MSPTAAVVVRIAVGELSRRAADTRSSCTPNIGTGNGTAIMPASSAP